ncbi:hypothetical protein SBRCBS47491_007770 [Sporothrix bragantina]|uniref:Uncharacterized protein n=1 Tax=Sporothrix bragantina TaxID=671064 RepID=A0ABP0CFU8_9PEZI
MDFAPYQSSPPEHERVMSPPAGNSTTSPRASLERRPFSPKQTTAANTASPPPLQHPQPQRRWSNGIPSPSYFSYQQGGNNGHNDLEGGAGGYGGSPDVQYDNGRDGVINEFDTSLGLRLDYEACMAYLLLPPLGSVLLLVLERKSDYVRFHAWQGSLTFSVMIILHLIFHRVWFLSWVIFLCHLALMGWLAFNAYRDADTLDRYEIPYIGPVASRIVDDE